MTSVCRNAAEAGKSAAAFNLNSEIGFCIERSVAVLGHSNVASSAFENVLRLGWRMLLRPRTGALRGTSTDYSRFPF